MKETSNGTIDLEDTEIVILDPDDSTSRRKPLPAEDPALENVPKGNLPPSEADVESEDLNKVGKQLEDEAPYPPAPEELAEDETSKEPVIPSGLMKSADSKESDTDKLDVELSGSLVEGDKAVRSKDDVDDDKVATSKETGDVKG